LDIKRLANSGALKTTIYVPGKSKKEVEQELNIQNPIKMASNENPYGASEKAKDSILRIKDSINIYPDSLNLKLRKKLASILHCNIEEIAIGNGADGIIYDLGMAIIDQEDEVIIPEITFPIYEKIINVMRGSAIISKMKNLRIDLNDIKEKVTDKTKAILICNPNNPTGDILKEDELISFLNEIPRSILAIFDEAYIDFTEEDEKPNTIRLFKQGMDNLFIIRTLSKLYGLAGIRVGYGIANMDLISLIHRIKPPFEVSLIAENAAINALSDYNFTKKTLYNTHNEKNFIYSILEKLELNYIRSHTNFILIDTKFDSTEVFNRMLKKGVIVRSAKSYNLASYIRVTVGKHDENLIFCKALKEVIEKLRSK